MNEPTEADRALDLPALLEGHLAAEAAMAALGLPLPDVAVEICGVLRRAIAAESRLRTLTEVADAARNYVRCLLEPHLSPYIRENGRHGKSPWAELVDAVAALPKEE